MSKPKIIFLPHANIQYSQLSPERRAWVCKKSYEKLFDLVMSKDCRIAFEASGRTLEVMADETPEVLEKLTMLIKEGKVEPVGSPHIHIMMSNVPQEIALQTLKDGMDTWERFTGVRPKVGWNPECSWTSYLPDLYKDAGYETLIMDGDSFLLSFPEIREATSLHYDVRGHSNKNSLFKIEEFIKSRPDYLRFLTNPSVAANGLNMIFRSDCMGNPMLWYLMGATEGVRDEPVSLAEITEMLERWKERIAETGTFIIPYAEDAEYIGTSAYFYVKQFNQARFFEPEPDSVTRFSELLEQANACGYEFSTPSDVIATANEIIENPFVDRIENGVAWHGGTAKAWANTPYARIFDPICRTIHDGIKVLREQPDANVADAELSRALSMVISAFVSDSRWPPAPTSPGRFNVRESLDDLFAANTSMKQAMEVMQIREKRALYSPEIMDSQIKAIEEELMALSYFGE